MKLSPEAIEKHTRDIQEASHEELAAIYRFSPSGHPYFDSDEPLWELFRARFFDELGGFNPTLSKKIGWEN